MKNRKKLTWVAGEKTPEKTYITRVINFGNAQEWKRLKKRFSRKQIVNALTHPLKGQWTPRGKAFAELIFNTSMPDSVLISYHG